ncbi:PUA-like domain-containing protein [Cadophora sp. MPI-SDFR-AT-0126]|nr:PUA-like domain-containing protein [Leotiomycetes sp. MPI-SDFR-AT-0126]
MKCLQTKGTIPRRNVEELTALFDALLQIEVSARPSTEIDLLIHTRLDELLKDIVDSRETMCHNLDRSQVTIFIKAGSLRRKWERRFKELYFNINKPRTEHMKINGPLRGLSLIESNGEHGMNWLVSYIQPAGLEGHANFTPGHWWLNIHCAFRDGAVGSVDKMLTMGQSGVVALALLTGEEITGPTLNLFEYTKIGHNMDELMKLMACNRGRPIRILRGSSLKSKYAPTAGVRYDGLHVVRQFGHKLLDETKNVYRCTIMLERSTSQKLLAEILRLPKPSQLDEWRLYRKLIGEEYRKREGESAFEKWTDLEEEQQAEKEQFLKARALREGIRQYTLVERKPSYLQSQ